MRKINTLPSNIPSADAEVVVERARATDTEGHIDLRIGSDIWHRIDDAAAIIGKTRIEFMIESDRREAIDMLTAQRRFTLDAKQFDTFAHVLDTPPTPGPKLRSLLCRVPAWQT